MANKGGIITRKDMFADDAMRFGEDYTKNLKQAIDANETLVASVKELNTQVQKFKVANSQKDYITAKQAEALATQQAIDAIKKQEAAEVSAEKIKRQAIATSELERKVKEVVEKSQERLTAAKIKGNGVSSEEIVNQGVLARNSKTQAILNSKLTTEYEKLTAKQRLAATALQNIQITGRKADESMAQYTLRLQKAQIEFNQLNERVVQANRAISRFNDNVGNYPQNFAAQIKDLIGAFGIVAGVDLFATSVKAAFDTVRNFEAEMVNLAAIAGFTREEIQPLELQIREVAKVSINSATDVAKLATELIKLGSTPEEVMKLLQPVNNLSIALKASAEDSATLVKSLLNAYQEGAEEATRFTDVLAESANRSALDFEGLKDAFSYLAPTANVLGISLERTAAIIGTLTDNGIKAESAGRLMNTGFARLSQQGLTLEQALAKINKAQKENKSSMDVLNIANNLFGNEAGKLGLILANNTEKIDESTKAYENSKGALQELTDKQLKSINSELEVLSSAWEEYILNTNEANGGTRAITSVLQTLSGNLAEIANAIAIAASVWAAYRASLILAGVQSKLMALALQYNSLAQVENTAATAVGTTAQEVNTVATTVATGAWERFNTALKANLLGIIAVAIIGIIYLFEKFHKSLEEITDATQKSTSEFLKHKEVVSKNAVSLTTLANRYDELKAKSKLTTDEQKELNKIMKLLSETVPEATAKMDKYGDAIVINSGKVREYVKLQNEVLRLKNAEKLKENIDLLAKLKKEQSDLNILSKEGKQTSVGGKGEDFAIIKNVNGVLKTRNNVLEDWRNLTQKQLLLYKETQLAVEKDVFQTQAQIDALKGLTAAEKQAAKAKSDKAGGESPVVKDIAYYRELIKIQEDLIPKLTDRTGKEGAAIKAKIKGYEAEIEKIYSTEKADKKVGKDRLKNAKDVADAIYNLSQFRYSREIEINQRIVDNEKKGIDERQEALYNLEQIRNAKNDETLEHDLLNLALEKKGIEEYSKQKLDLYIKDANARIQALISGKIAVEKMTNDEKLILEKFSFEKKKLGEQDLLDRQALIDKEVAIVQKSIDNQLQEQNRQLNEAIEAENIRFLAVNNLEKMNFKQREDAVKEHERQIFEIKKKFALDGLKVQIDALKKELEENDKLPVAEQISADLRKKIGADLQAAQTQYAELNTQNYIENVDKRTEKEKEFSENVKQLSEELTNALGNLANALFERKISNIDAEIQKEQSKYDAAEKAAGNDQRKKDLLAVQFEKKRQALEKKKREEQHKQAVFNKAMSIVQTSILTAQAVMKGFSESGYVGAILAAAIGAIELAAIIATPIPKYKDGRKGGKKEVAMINEVVPEVVERKDGRAEVFSGKNRIVQLYEGDTVHKSVEDYMKLQRAAMFSSLDMEGKKMSDFQAAQYFESAYSKEMVSEMKLTRKAIEKLKFPAPVASKAQDLNHDIFRFKNTNWS